MRLVLRVFAACAVLLAGAPFAAASDDPPCLQAWPMSLLCETGVEDVVEVLGFVCVPETTECVDVASCVQGHYCPDPLGRCPNGDSYCPPEDG